MNSNRKNKSDLIASIVIMAIGLYALVSGIFMTIDKTGADKWYYSPGFFPIFLGSILVILGLIMFISKHKEGAKIEFSNIKNIKYLKNNEEFKKTLIAIGTLAIYVFVMFGRLPFIISTFIYLFVTMTIFRTDKYAIWKICIISLLVSVFLYMFFVVVAKVPLA